MAYPPAIQELITAWQAFIDAHPWKSLIGDVESKQTGYGQVYELQNFLGRPDESFAIADMHELAVAEPHFHPGTDYECYFVLRGTAIVVVGGVEQAVLPGDVVVVPPDHAHYTIPDDQFVVAVVNTPPSRADHYCIVRDTDASVLFDYEQFVRLTTHPQST